ncbi:MAG TPA: maltose alpha-D-glucosyltransferase [Vicinamibacteria bacterium]|nr:maltose alpha-D-glucosyltransferase [Vicinamibacteria bacterium]
MRASTPARKRTPRPRAEPKAAPAGGHDPLWYKDAILYELSVRAFADGDADGVGDFAGLTSRLDYLQALGATALWLQPFYPSPLRDGGYDVSDHRDVLPDYGTLADFERFLAEAHRRRLRVIVEVVLNHTSDRHPWFQRARAAPPGSPERDFYVWSDRADRYPEARVLFADAEASNWAWDPTAGAYYWHRFYGHEPDLNFDNPAVRREMAGVLDHWLGLGVDGVRLDAVSFLFEREGTACEDLPETHAFLRELRGEVDRKFPGRILVTEANLWPEDAAAYFGRGDECHLAFHTPLMPRLFTALHLEDRYPVLEMLSQTPEIPPSAQWALFLRNHDELTLEMVTDEERDVMYRAYAAEAESRLRQGIRRRLAPLLGNDRRRLELLYGLLCSLPGTPAVYYGDEIGMGDNVYLGDRMGVRTPMQWSGGTNAGFSEANPQRLFLPPVTDPEFSYVSVNVATQEANPRSLLWWMRRLFAQRQRIKAFGRGAMRLVPCSSRKVLAFVREAGDERVLVAANLSRHVQHVELDLSPWRGLTPVELSGRTEFPAVEDRPYALTLAGHAFYWLALQEGPVEGATARPLPGAAAARGGEGALPRLSVPGRWEAVLRGREGEALGEVLAGFLTSRRWFAGKARRIRSVELQDAVPIPVGSDAAWVTLAHVSYAEGEGEIYALPLAFATGERASRVRRGMGRALVAELEVDGQTGLLYAAEGDPELGRALLEAVARGRRFEGEAGEIVAEATSALRERGDPSARAEPRLLSAEQSNSSIRFGQDFIMKLFRKVEPGTNPDLEVGRFLTGTASFPHTPPVYGSLEYEPRRGRAITLAILQGFVPNEGDAWAYTLDAVGRFFEGLVSRREGRRPAPSPPGPLLETARTVPTPPVGELIGAYLDSAGLLGRRTAELHRALVSDPGDPAFAPEPFTRIEQRAQYQSQRNLVEDVFELLRRRLPALAGATRAEGERVLEARGAVLDRFRRLLERRLTAARTRTHGDYHLGQVLWTGRDFVIIDFEGEPARPATVRRAKRSPLRDVAGMLRSYHYAAYQGLSTFGAKGAVPRGQEEVAESWARFWYGWVSGAFLRGYLEAAGDASFLPRTTDELDDLLVVHVLEKAVYELGYELNNRPDWVKLPLQGIASLVSEEVK